jgi:probable rRNA maturation factor
MIRFQKKYFFFLKKTKEKKKWIERCVLLKKYKIKNICFIFCNEKTIKKINNKHLLHNYFTDVITFSYTNFEKKELEGEIIISIPTVKKNSIIHKNSFGEELDLVMIHGVIHLMGINDQNEKEKKKMRKFEKFFLNLRN